MRLVVHVGGSERDLAGDWSANEPIHGSFGAEPSHMETQRQAAPTMCAHRLRPASPPASSPERSAWPSPSSSRRLSRRIQSPVLDVGDRVIDRVPAWLKNLAIDWFGTNDKIALLVGIGSILAVYAAVCGLVAARRDVRVGYVGVALFGVVGAWAALASRTGAPWWSISPSIIGAACARRRVAPAPPPGPGPGPRGRQAQPTSQADPDRTALESPDADETVDGRRDRRGRARDDRPTAAGSSGRRWRSSSRQRRSAGPADGSPAASAPPTPALRCVCPHPPRR